MDLAARLRAMIAIKRYGGHLIHHQSDDVGVIEVVDTDGIRSLHFGTRSRQSAFCLNQPDRVELSYIRAMLLNLVFGPEPRRVLILGLGGGSLARFFLTHYPDARLVVVEYRSAVARVARQFFGVPESPRLELHIADCRDYLHAASAANAEPFDHIYIDAFDMDGLSPSINRPDFFQGCGQLLQPDGSLAINLWGHHRLCLDYSLRLLGGGFPDRSVFIRVPHKDNVIGFGWGQGVSRNPEREARTAVQLWQQKALELPDFLQACQPVRARP